MDLNTFRIEHAFQSEAGPLWICRQVYNKQESEQVDRNPLLLFWRNDLLRKPRRYGNYSACWTEMGIKCHGMFLLLFLPGKTPFLGAYRVHSHLHSFDLEYSPITQADFEPAKAYQAQARLRMLDQFTPERFIETYGDIRRSMEELPEA